MRNFFLFLLYICSMFGTIQTYANSVRTIKITGKYLNLPIKETGKDALLTISLDGKEITHGQIVLSSAPDYWMFYDVSAFAGKKLTLNYASEDQNGIQAIEIADTLRGQASLYKESMRPQYHFSASRGWINDPNGLVYYDGEYHLFYQWNPFGVKWGNLNWGHAVSRDLLHWQELPLAIAESKEGEIYSGSAIVDYNNVSGLGSKKKPAMLAFYTLQANDGQVQCLAYSTDHGRTWKQYKHNPIVDTKMKWGTWHNRDPKVFWYEPGGHYVMVLHEKDGPSIYTSTNLIDWKYESHTAGIWECPELFPLAVDDDPNNVHWVMPGASGTYMIGQFDGRKFTPEAGKFYYANGYLYAGQTFNDVPDGRRIQIGWASIRKEGMPFTGEMLLPVELKLTQTKDGIRLKSKPIKEVESLLTPILSAEDLTMEQANELLSKVPSTDGICIKTTLQYTHPTNAGLELEGHRILDCDMNFNRINKTPYFPQEIGGMTLSFDIYIDRMSIETFVDDGLFTDISERPYGDAAKGIRFWSLDPLIVKKVEVFQVSRTIY